MSQYKLPIPPPPQLKMGDMVFSPDLDIKEFITEIFNQDDRIIISLLNRKSIIFRKESKTYWCGNIPIEYIYFFTRITQEEIRDYKIDEIIK